MAAHVCRPDTAVGPGVCGAPAAYAVEFWPSYGSTWHHTEPLYLCPDHAGDLGWHYGPLLCLACGETVAGHRAGEHGCTGCEEITAGEVTA